MQLTSGIQREFTRIMAYRQAPADSLAHSRLVVLVVRLQIRNEREVLAYSVLHPMSFINAFATVRRPSALDSGMTRHGTDGYNSSAPTYSTCCRSVPGVLPAFFIAIAARLIRPSSSLLRDSTLCSHVSQSTSAGDPPRHVCPLSLEFVIITGPRPGLRGLLYRQHMCRLVAKPHAGILFVHRASAPARSAVLPMNQKPVCVIGVAADQLTAIVAFRSLSSR